MPTPWCPVCCTNHDLDGTCPGELRATGVERHGWRVRVDSPVGSEAIGVLVAPAGTLFRARILTYPSMLWTVPGGSGTIKFVGRTPQEAEERAIRFISRHIEARGYIRNDQLAPVHAGKIVAEAAGSGAYPKGAGPPRRKVRSLPVHFGTLRPISPGWTLNVSREGLFVTTPDPLARQAPVALVVDLQGLLVRLSGNVVWNRRELEPGRPLGMGIRLSNPPETYVSFYRSLT